MDAFALLFVLALVALSCFKPDWEREAQTAWKQVFAMSLGLVLLGLYMLWRTAG